MLNKFTIKRPTLTACYLFHYMFHYMHHISLEMNGNDFLEP